jgi:hypothetical protein
MRIAPTQQALHSGTAGSVSPCARCEPRLKSSRRTNPDFHEFLGIRQRLAQAAAPRESCPGAAAIKALPARRDEFLPRLSDVAPVETPARSHAVIREYRTVRTVATGSLIDLVV